MAIGTNKKYSQADLAVRWAQGSATYFHSPDGRTYARIIERSRGGAHTVPIKSMEYRNYMSLGFHRQYKKALSSRGMEDALSVMGGMALEGYSQEVGVRVMGWEGKIYVDLANENRDVVEITKEGWRITNTPPVSFIRPKNILPLPYPGGPGRLSDLWDMLLLSEPDRTLITSWILMAYNPSGPYPILAVNGANGVGKTTTVRMTRRVIDPCVSEVRSMPRNDRDLFVGAASNWIMAFDNVSNLPDWMSDSLCRLSTGGGYGARTHHTMDEETVIDHQRPIILNSIPTIVSRPDLADRVIVITPNRIAPSQRRTMGDLDQQMKDLTPGILEEVFDIVSVALKNSETMKLKDLPRMADFAKWIASAGEGLHRTPEDIVGVYKANTEDIWLELAGEEPLVELVIELLNTSIFGTQPGLWSGTATQLMSALKPIAYQKSLPLPDYPRTLSGNVRRCEHLLQVSGIFVDNKKIHGQRVIELKRVP